MGVLFFWMPRSLWPNKPNPTGELVAEHVGYAYTNLSAPLWAEVYLAGGLFFTLCGFYLLGVLVRHIEQVAEHCRGREVSVASVLVPFLAAYQFFLLRGTLLSAVAYLTPVLLFFLAFSARLPKIFRSSVRA
jgi:hypothetical protein